MTALRFSTRWRPLPPPACSLRDFGAGYRNASAASSSASEPVTSQEVSAGSPGGTRGWAPTRRGAPAHEGLTQ
jgi:hypothetical protein